MINDLFSVQRPEVEEVYDQVWLLANFTQTPSIIDQITQLAVQAPFRKMMTPMGHYTGIPLTNCGEWGWTSDASGYRYQKLDPETQSPWPKMPESFRSLAIKAANEVGFEGFSPDACLINQYDIGTKLSAHQDKNESDFRWPIVSVSIGLPAEFQIFGDSRNNRPVNVKLYDGDVMVWGGKSRLIYHGVKTIKADIQTPNLTQRFNITLRRAK